MKSPGAASINPRVNITELSPEARVLHLEGELDLHVSTHAAAELNVLTHGKFPLIVVDLEKVTYVDSSGLAVLIGAMQTVKAYGGRFVLTALHRNVLHIFETAQVMQVFEIHPDLQSVPSARS